MQKILIPLFCLLLINTCNAQNEFQKGFLVALNGDTIQGLVKDRKEDMFPKLYEKIRFKQSDKKVTSKYHASEIKAYSVNGQLYESANESALEDGLLGRLQPENTQDNSIFLKVITKGPASHYQLEWVEQESGVIETIDYLKKTNSPIFIRSTQGIFGLKKRRITEYFNDCPILQSKIESKELVTSQEVVNFYNDWILD